MNQIIFHAHRLTVSSTGRVGICNRYMQKYFSHVNVIFFTVAALVAKFCWLIDIHTLYNVFLHF